METLTSSPSRVFAENCRGRDREVSLLSPAEVLGRPELRFLSSPKRFAGGFSQSISLQYKRIHPVLVSAPSSSSETQKQLPDEESSIQDVSKTVRVRFQLQKKCAFGEQFHIVGDDPVLGSWDPSSAISLDWSEGHVWNVELDVPIGKPIQFKFILKGRTGNFLWQPDPDRVLETWETNNIISVSEDWRNAELQTVIEEETISDIKEPMENLNSQAIGLMPDVNGESVTTDNIATSEEKQPAEKSISIVAENISDSVEEPQVLPNKKEAVEINEAPAEEETVLIIPPYKDVAAEESSLGIEGRAVTITSIESTMDEGILVSYEGDPVLVPGLAPLTTGESVETLPSEVENSIAANASLAADKTKKQNMPELGVKKEPNDEQPHFNNSTEIMFETENNPTEIMFENKELPGNQQVENLDIRKEQDQANQKPPESDVLGSDLQWGRKTLQKLLSGFRFI